MSELHYFEFFVKVGVHSTDMESAKKKVETVIDADNFCIAWSFRDMDEVRKI